MLLLQARVSAEEALIACLNEGYELRRRLWADYAERVAATTFDSDADVVRYRAAVDEWIAKTASVVGSIFPTSLEVNRFLDVRSSLAVSYSGIDQKFGKLYHQTLPEYINRLENIVASDLQRYTDLPPSHRLFVEQIDSFRHVRDVNPAVVARVLPKGFLDYGEDRVQIALEQILDVPFHKKDWGGEGNDLYTANVVVNGRRVATAFLLKGNGLKRKEMRIADCGKNGDQILRLLQSPAELFVVQYVGPISEGLTSHLADQVRLLNLEGRVARYMLIDGQDTARLLYAYGKL